jgi:hypothetical protein
MKAGLLQKIFGKRVVRVREMTDARLWEAMDVPEDHPVLEAVMELIERAKEDAVREACGAVASDREVAFYLGGRYALESLEGFLAQMRAEAVRRGRG